MEEDNCNITYLPGQPVVPRGTRLRDKMDTCEPSHALGVGSRGEIHGP